MQMAFVRLRTLVPLRTLYWLRTLIRSLAAGGVLLLVTACGNDEVTAPDAAAEDAAAGAAAAEAAVDLTNVDWSVYLGDEGRGHFSPLTQVNRENVDQLELAWSYNSGEPSGTMYTSPVVKDGRLYSLSPKLHAFALNAATGEELWRHDPELPGGAQRGLMWWEQGDDRRILYTAGRILIALNADDGTPVTSFGDGGRVDLTPKDVAREGYLAVTVPGVVFEDKILLGFSTTEGADSFPGSVRAFSAVDGSLVWQFDMIPKPGERGSETWAEGSLERAGGANVWTGMALDVERGILFAPTGSTTPDFYGGNRHGDNLYGNSIVAINARNGEYVWHHQVVKHDLWDKDNPSPPTLVTYQKDGKTVDGVALTTKTGHLFVFNRETGEPHYDLLEVKTPIPSTLPGEAPSPVQHVSTVEIARQTFEVTQRNPEATAFVEEQIVGADLRPWAPPRVGTVIFSPWYDGGAEWGGSAFDPTTGSIILNANDAAAVLTLSEIPKGFTRSGAYARHCGACHGSDLKGTDVGPSLIGVVERIGWEKIGDIVDNGAGRMPAFQSLKDYERRGILGYMAGGEPEEEPPSEEVDYVLTSGYVFLKDHEGLPANTPPWGTLQSIDVTTGKHNWNVNFGNFLTHPDLGYGAINYGGPVVTASGLIFIAATPDKKLSVYDAKDGALLWQADLPAAGFSTPAVYSVDGRQYVVIAAGGARLGPPAGSEYLAFALPQADDSP